MRFLLLYKYCMLKLMKYFFDASIRVEVTSHSERSSKVNFAAFCMLKFRQHQPQLYLCHTCMAVDERKGSATHSFWRKFCLCLDRVIWNTNDVFDLLWPDLPWRLKMFLHLFVLHWRLQKNRRQRRLLINSCSTSTSCVLPSIVLSQFGT